MVAAGEIVGEVGGEPVIAQISGVIRGLLRSEALVTSGLKIGDVDPRGDPRACNTISDKARALGGAVLEAILFQLPERLRHER